MRIFVLFVGFVCWGCGRGGGGGSSVPDSLSLVRDTAPALHRTEGLPFMLVVATEQALVRTEPRIDAPELLRLHRGDSLLYANMVSERSLRLRLEGMDYDEPWLKVQTPDNRSGWIYGGCVRFDGLSNEDLAERVLERRLLSLFGSETATRLRAHQRACRDIGSQTAFDLQWEQSEALRTELEAKIEQHLTRMEPGQPLPDFFWLNGTLSGLVVAYPPSERGYRLFRDLRFWANQAAQTPQYLDDSLVSAFLTAYPDGLEFLYPEWSYALPEGAVYSRLGEGIHRRAMEQIGRLWTEHTPYRPYLNPLLRRLLDDISLCDTYWNSAAEARAELQQILQNPPPCLSPADLVELRTRLQMLQAPDKYGVRFALSEQI